MRFDPQANMVSGDANRGQGRAGNGGLRAGVLIFVLAVSGTLGVWMHKQVMEGPQPRSASADSGLALPITAQQQHRLHNAAAARAAGMQATPSSQPEVDVASNQTGAASSAHSGSMMMSQREQHFSGSTNPMRPPVVDSRRRHSIEAYQRGQSAMSNGRHGEAIEQFRQAISLHQDFADAHYALGLAYITTGDRFNAHQQERRLRELDPNLANLLRNLLR